MTAPNARPRFPLALRRHGIRLLAAVALSTGAGAARAAAASADEHSRTAVVEAARVPDHAQESGFPQGPLGINYLDLLERYLDLMQKFTRLAEDPAAAGVAGVFGSKDLLGSDGDPSKAIEFFNEVLPEVKNEAVQRAIRIELIDLYKKSGQRDKALEQLRILVISAPAERRDAREQREAREPGDRREGRPATEAPAPR